MEAAAGCIPTKLRAKHRVPWEQKRDDVKTASQRNRRKPIYANAQKLNKAQSELKNADLKKQTKYIQDQINKIKYSVEDRKYRIAWKTVSEVSKRKRTTKAKLKAASQEERIHLRKQHFKNLLGKYPSYGIA